MSRPTCAYVNQAALRHNLQQVKAYAPNSHVIAMVKANAYGHGIDHVIPALAAADSYGVASIDEALELRALGVTKSILLMEGFFDAAELPIIEREHLQIVVHSFWQLTALEQAKLNHPVMTWIKIDTGMHRLGFLPDEFNQAWQRLVNNENVKSPIGLITHFATADEPQSDNLQQQLDCFQQVTQNLIGPRSLANSAAIIACQASHGDWVRPGIMLYGASPFSHALASQYNLKPVMTLQSTLIAKHTLQKGDTIGYGCTYTCPHAMLVGVVAIGYGDGYPRHAKSGTPVLVNNKIVPLVGRVSMDMLTVDLTTIPAVEVGDRVVLWGEGLPVEKIALSAETIPYELLCHVSRRVPFIVK